MAVPLPVGIRERDGGLLTTVTSPRVSALRMFPLCGMPGAACLSVDVGAAAALVAPAPSSGPVEHDKGSASHRRVALDHLDVAGERRCLVLVPDFQRHRFDVDRLTIVLALQSALDLILRRSCPEHPQDQQRGEAIIRDSQRKVSRLRCLTFSHGA